MGVRTREHLKKPCDVVKAFAGRIGGEKNLEALDSRLRGNDREVRFQISYEAIQSWD